MQPNDIVNIISNLNYNLWENLKTPDDFVKTEFVYSTNGSVDVVKVADTVLWDSDNDTKDLYEDLETFLKKEYNKLMHEGYTSMFDLEEE